MARASDKPLHLDLETLAAGYGGKPVKEITKRHYGMAAEEIASRAPFEIRYGEVCHGGSERGTGKWQDITVQQGYVVLDKNGDRVFPPTDVGAQALCHTCAEELNFVAAKWLMENEGPASRDYERWEEISRYRK